MATEIKKLGIVILILISLAASVLIGGAILGGFSKTVRTSTSEAVDNLGLLWTNESYSLSAYDFPQSLTSCIKSNDSVSVPTSAYTVTEGFTSTSGELQLTADAYNGTTMNCTVTYLASNSASTSADLFTVGLLVFATFAGLIGLSVVGKTVIDLFKND